MRQDLHTHTTFSDGANTPVEMVMAAIEKGMDCIGFSDHSYTPFDESYCMRRENIPAYKACIAALKKKFGSRIHILCGIEQDFYGTEPTEDYDYIVGSVHYLHIGGEYVPVDETAEILERAAEQHFGGDIYALVECYFDTVALVAEKTNCDIIGHIDLITKFQGQKKLFDTAHPRYVSASRKAADVLIKAGKPFEINTSPLFRRAKPEPYPEQPLRDYLKERGAHFVLSGDCHSSEMLCFDFDKYRDYV